MEREGFKATKAAEKESASPALREGAGSGDMPRREFLKLGGVFAGILAESPKDAGALLAKILEEKEGEAGKGPKVNFEIFFGPHGSLKDTAGLAKRIAASDVYVPEAANWDEQDLALYRAVSQGRENPDKFHAIVKSRKPFQFGELKSLYNSKKAVFIADIPSDNKLADRIARAYEDMGEIDFNASFGRVLENYKKNVKKATGLQLQREQLILENLRKLRTEIKKGKFPDVDPAKKEVNILLFMGGLHTKIYHSLYETEDASSRSFPTMPFSYANVSFGTEAMRRAYFGKEIPDELAARSLLMNFSGMFILNKPALAPIWGDTLKTGRLLTKIFSAFSQAEARQIFEHVQKMNAPMRQYPAYLDAQLEQKGIHVPESAEELKEFFKDEPKLLRE